MTASLESELQEIGKQHPIYSSDGKSKLDQRCAICKSDTIRYWHKHPDLNVEGSICDKCYGDLPSNYRRSKKRNIQTKQEPKPSETVTKPTPEQAKKCVICKSPTTYVYKNGYEAWHREAPNNDNFLCQSCYTSARRKARKKEPSAKSAALGSLITLFEKQNKLLRERQQEILRRVTAIEKEKSALLLKAQAITKQLQGIGVSQ